MKVAFVCSEKYSKYDDKIRKIIESVNNRLIKNMQQAEINQIAIGTRKKYDLYFIVTNDIEDFNLICSKVKSKRNPVLITKNLEEKFIRSVIFSVKDILYIDNSLEVITNRIVSIIGKENV